MLHDNLKRIRKERNLTQQELAELVGLDRTTVTKYETGKAKPSHDVLLKLSGALDVSPAELLEAPPLKFDRDIPEFNERVLVLQRSADERGLTERELNDILGYAKYRYPHRFRGLDDELQE